MSNDFEVQLCNEWDGKTVPEHAIVQSKLDGVRCLFVIAKGRYCAYSRNGNPFFNVGHIAAELKSFDGWVLDGELVGPELGQRGWAKAVSAARSAEEEAPNTSLSFVVFDILKAEEFDARKSTKTLVQRQAILKAKMPKNRCFVGLVPSFPVKTAEDVHRLMKEFVKHGFEGAVLKDLDKPYQFKRSSAWVKVKMFTSGDYKVVGTEEGKGRLKGTLGKILVKGPKGTVSGVGTGFTDKQRDEAWKLGKKLIGRVAEVRYQDVSADGALRFPSFMRWRDDR